MERERIKVLLEKYWIGQTNHEEEQMLKKFFSGPSVPPEWRDQAVYFQYLELQKENSAPDDEELLKLVKNEATAGKSRGTYIKLWVERSMKMAAAIAVVVVAAIVVRQDYLQKKDQVEPVLADTFEDPQKAFEETKKALMLVSRQFGKGKMHAEKLSVFDDATEKVQQEREL